MRNRFLTLLLGSFLYLPLQAQSGAEIQVLTPDVCVPGKVSLRVINCNSCISYEWEVISGTGFKFAGSDYSTIISDTGWMDVSVKLKTSAGAILLLNKKKAFYGRTSPKVDFSVSKANFCQGSDTLVVTDNTPNSKSRDWLIDGKVFYNGPQQLKYPMPTVQGFKSIYLLVRDSWDCKGKMLKDSAVGVWDSVQATIKASKTKGCAPAYIDYSFSADSGVHKIKNVLWTFEKGIAATSTSRTPKSIYYSTGDTFDVNLRITTDKSCVYNYKYNNFLSLGDTSNLVISIPKLKYCVNEPVTVTVKNYRTAFSMWTVKNVKVKQDSLIGNKVVFTFSDTGHPVFTVMDNDRGCRSYATFDTIVTSEGPVVNINSESPFYCGVPKTLNFGNLTKEYPGVATWEWKLWQASGSLVTTASTKNFSYNTSSGLNYDIQLKATGTNGCKDSMRIPSAVVFGHIDSNFTVVPNPTCPGRAVTAIPKAGPGSTVHPNMYEWWFYDKAGKVVFTEKKQKPSYTYTSEGSYSIKMKVSNNDNCMDSLFLKDTIHVSTPKVDLEVADTFVCLKQPLKIKANYSSPKGGFSIYWVFRNIDSTDSDVYFHQDSGSVMFYKTGRYRIAYVVTDTAKNGCNFIFVHPNLIKVSGIMAHAATDKPFGCVPLQMNLSSKLLFNVNYKNPGNTISYQWKSYFPAEVSFASPNATSTVATVNTAKDQYLTIVFTNQDGCKDSSPWVKTDTRFEASFNLDANTHCVGQKGKITNLSTYWATNYKYSADPSVIFTPSDNIPEPVVQFTKAGVFPVRLIISSGSCVDTGIFYVEITDIQADFYTPDSVSYCAPRLINLINNTKNTVTNYWNFGDGDSAKTMFNDMAGHLYLKNNSRPGYDIRLIAVNQYGCRDTLLKKGYLRLIGPVPEFTVQNTVGCEPLNVKFTNTSRDYSLMFVDYDNGVVLDSSVLGTYPYTVTNKALVMQKYRPKILLYDSFGCSALAYSPDTIIVHKAAEAQYTFSSVNFLRKTEGCANDLLVKFSNKSKFYVKLQWDFNGDGTVDMLNQSNPNYLFDKSGIFKPILMAENFNGCRDTFSLDSIVVWEPPQADFISSADTVCAINPVKFWSTSKFTHPVVSYSWNFGELPVFDDTATIQSPVWKYNTPFNHAVRLRVNDTKGCYSEIIRNVFVNDTAGPVKPELAYITVRDDKYVDFYWRRSKLGNFYNYRLYADSIGLWQKYQTYDRKDTSYSVDFGNEVDNRRFCYTIRVEDTCNQIGKAAVSHCTMVLRDTVTDPFHIKLSWLAYDWWDTELDHYEIFRKDDGGNYVKITDVKTNRLSFTDSFLCNKNYCYYVEAVHKNREYRSRSNVVCRKPLYVKPDSFVNTTFVSVRDNQFTEVFWKPYYKYYRDWTYELERSANGLPGSFSSVAITRNTSVLDMSANVHDRVNYYRVKFRDHCGVEAVPGSVSNTIWLRNQNQSRALTSLSWSAYNYWYSGVRNYGIQLKGANGTFNTIMVLPPNVTKVDSLNIESYQVDSVCFRVFAVKDTLTSDTSWSNELCMVPSSYVHVPTAFTPDDNQLNEVFKPVTGFIHRNTDDFRERYELRVYNRWGQMVFESFDPDLGWDGRVGGNKAPSGLYIWNLKALGYDGIPHRLDGTVYLIR